MATVPTQETRKPYISSMQTLLLVVGRYVQYHTNPLLSAESTLQAKNGFTDHRRDPLDSFSNSINI